MGNQGSNEWTEEDYSEAIRLQGKALLVSLQRERQLRSMHPLSTSLAHSIAYTVMLIWTAAVMLAIGALAVATFQDEGWSIASVALWSGVALLAIYVILWFTTDDAWRSYIKQNAMILSEQDELQWELDRLKTMRANQRAVSDSGDSEQHGNHGSG